MFYAGIGSRDTPARIQTHMTNLAAALSFKGYTLRSGGAEGADKAFERGASSAEIYVPWVKRNDPINYLTPPDEAWAASIAEQFHPAWVNLTSTIKKVIARNTCQVLGRGPDGPKSKFVLCWTPGGKHVGGTSQAIRIANAYNIPVFNYGDPEYTEEALVSLVGMGI